MKRGHTPIRTCIACRRRRPKSEMIRLTAQGAGATVSPEKDPTLGRGCYICPTWECIDRACSRGRTGKALKTAIDAPPTQEEFLRGLKEKGFVDGDVDRG